MLNSVPYMFLGFWMSVIAESTSNNFPQTGSCQMLLNQVSGQFNTAVYTWALNNLVWTPLFMALKGKK